MFIGEASNTNSLTWTNRGSSPWLHCQWGSI